MKKAILMAALPLVQLIAGQAFAGDSAPAPKTRTDVKEETRAAVRSGEMATPAEARPADAVEGKGVAGNRSRKDVKEETRAAARSGELPRTGEGAQVEAVEKKAGTKTRREVRAERKSAADLVTQPAPESKGR